MKTVITPHPSIQTAMRQVLQKKNLLYLLTKRQIYLRYKYKTVGIFWGLLQPLLLAFVISQSLGRTVLLTIPLTQYFLSIFIGYVFWLYFATTVSKATQSLFANRTLIRHAAFPHIILPLSTVGVGFIDFSLSLILACVFSLVFHFHISFLPLLLIAILMMLLTTFGIGALFSVLYTKYSDLREVLSFFLTVLFYLTPIIYPVQIIPKAFHAYLYLNPMAGVIETAKGVLFNPSLIQFDAIAISMVSSISIFLLGTSVFFFMDKDISDIV